MARYIRVLIFCTACLAAGAVSTASCVDPSEISLCDEDAGVPKGKILNGKPEATVTAPYVVRGTIDSSTASPTVAINYVTVAGVMATPTSVGTTVVPNYGSWSATLSKDDLEAHRVGTEAQIDVVAIDVCGRATTVDSLAVPIGPNPVKPISGLMLSLKAPSSECYLPSDGSAAATVEVSADASYWGAAVNVGASIGTLSPSGAVTLNKNGISDLFLTGAGKAGTAVITASAGGVSIAPQSILVSTAPAISSATGSAHREVPYSLYVYTTGHLKDCRIEPTDPATVTATVMEPTVIPISGVTTVTSGATDCKTPDLFRVEILFAKNAPSGALITLKCRDTFLQEGAASITAAVDGDGGP